MGTRNDNAGLYVPTIKGILATYQRRTECGHILCWQQTACIYVPAQVVTS